MWGFRLVLGYTNAGRKGAEAFPCLELVPCPGLNPSAEMLNVPRKGIQMSIVQKKEETKENWYKTRTWTNGSKLTTSFWRSLWLFLQLQEGAECLKMQETILQNYRRKGQMGLNCCLGKSQTFMFLLEWKARGQAHCSALLLLLFHLFLQEGRIAVKSSISSCCRWHIKCVFFFFFSSDSTLPGPELMLRKALRKGKGKLWRQCFLLGSDLQALGKLYCADGLFHLKSSAVESRIWRHALQLPDRGWNQLISFHGFPEQRNLYSVSLERHWFNERETLRL